MIISNPFLFFLTMMAGGLLLEASAVKLHYALTKKHLKKIHFSFGRYIYLLLLPILAFIIMTQWYGLTIFRMFLVSAFLGPILEWVVGLSYHIIVGQKLLTYHRYSINGYTSFLTIPMWGLGGILAYLLASTL